jgi:hypothetical protein
MGYIFPKHRAPFSKGASLVIFYGIKYISFFVFNWMASHHGIKYTHLFHNLNFETAALSLWDHTFNMTSISSLWSCVCYSNCDKQGRCIADNQCTGTLCSVHQSMDFFTGGLLTSSTKIVSLCHTLDLVSSRDTQRSCCWETNVHIRDQIAGGYNNILRNFAF